MLYWNKIGFAVLIRSWFRGPLRDRVRDAVSGGLLAETGYFDMAFVGKQVCLGPHEHCVVVWNWR